MTNEELLYAMTGFTADKLPLEPVHARCKIVSREEICAFVRTLHGPPLASYYFFLSWCCHDILQRDWGNQ